MKKKVCIVATSLDNGGAERSAATQSIILDSLGFEVFIVTVDSGIAYNYKGVLFDLGSFKKEKDSFAGRIKRLYIFKKFLKRNKIDLIIDNRPRNQWYREFILTKFIYKYNTIYVIHSFEKALAFTKYKWLNTYLYSNERMIAVSNKAAEKFTQLYNLNKVSTIYNAFQFDDILQQSNQVVDLSNLKNYIIYYGRIHDKAKNLKLLLKAYKLSSLSSQNIKLLVLGDGPDLNEIKDYSKGLNIDDNVVFKAFSKKPFPYVKNAIFSVLTSRSEGFAMVLPESMCLGTPVISVDCEAGPKEIIKNLYNGLLVENCNPDALANAMDRFINDKYLYKKCANNAALDIDRFSISKIKEEWRDLILEFDT
ncbi:glycosyltransferase [Thalassobellus sediminis]|uniref:glycosyltransferase n=1 Tax=Thalassobellus sediminis TaxID=3367753 RepID=UPI0037BAA440